MQMWSNSATHQWLPIDEEFGGGLAVPIEWDLFSVWWIFAQGNDIWMHINYNLIRYFGADWKMGCEFALAVHWVVGGRIEWVI